MATLFISHAAADKPLVEAVVTLLESGVGVPHADIFCSSLKGQSIKPGKDFVDSIRESLDESACVMALISEAYYASAFCMCELGGVWLASKSLLPVLVPPLDYSSLKAVLSGVQVSKIVSDDDLDEMRDELIERLGIKKPHATPRWNQKRKEFQEGLPKRLKEITFQGPVPRDKFDKLQKEVESFKAECDALNKKLSAQHVLVAELKKAKDAKAVAKLVRKHNSAIDTFESLVATAKKSLQGLPRAVREALYYRTRDEDYQPEGDDWDSVKSPLENGQLSVTGDNDDAVCANEGNASVRRAAKALDELAEWLKSDLPADFLEWYEQEADEEEPNITLRSFWSRHL